MESRDSKRRGNLVILHCGFLVVGVANEFTFGFGF